MNLYVILIIISAIRNEKILSFDYSSNGGLIALSFNYYNNNRTGLFINTAFPFSIINKRYIDEIGNKRMLDLSKSIVEKHYGYTLTDRNFTLGQVYLEHYKYYIQSNDNKHLSDVLSLSYKHDEESLSLIHLLYKERQIEKRQFAFDGIKRNLFFGGIPEDTHKTKLYQGHCKVKDNEYEWTCPMMRISYGDTVLEMNEDVVFYSAIDDAIYSNVIFNFFTNVIFKDNIDKNQCMIKEIEGEVKFLHCLGLVFHHKLENLNITIGQMMLSIPTEDLFGYYGKQDSLVNNNPFPEYYNKTIIGMLLLSKFNYIVFDYDNKVVEFYSDTYPIIQYKDERNESIKPLYICVILIQLVGVIQLLIQIKNINK